MNLGRVGELISYSIVSSYARENRCPENSCRPFFEFRRKAHSLIQEKQPCHEGIERINVIQTPQTMNELMENIRLSSS